MSREDDLRSDLQGLDPALRSRLDAAGFDAERLVTLARPLFSHADGGGAAGGGAAGASDRNERNRVRGVVEAPKADDVPDAPSPSGPRAAEYTRLAAVGRDAIARGELAFCVMAGGMATRMGGVVKALVDAFDGHTFLELRLNENAHWSSKASNQAAKVGGRPVPLWLMTSDATDAPIRAALEKLGAPAHVATFRQDLGLRLTQEGRLFVADDGQPSTYAPGHGDLPDALRRSGLLASFVKAGGKYVWIANLDNLGASVDEALLGWFIERQADVLVEVAPKAPGDKGGIPAWADVEGPDGKTIRRLQVLEEFRLPPGFDADAVRVFNTNTFLVRAEPLLHADVRYSWFEVEKKVGGRVAVQFERLLQELTTALPAVYARISRDGAASRFLPVKDFDELARRRADIEAVAAARGMMPV
jgi:UTP--glucose-1-phosphate uridylyltransferase